MTEEDICWRLPRLLLQSLETVRVHIGQQFRLDWLPFCRLFCSMALELLQARDEPSVHNTNVGEESQLGLGFQVCRSVDGSQIPFVELQLTETGSVPEGEHDALKKGEFGQLQCSPPPAKAPKTSGSASNILSRDRNK